MARKSSSPTIPPLPINGGSYELIDGQWVCTQRTLQPGEDEPCQNELETVPVEAPSLPTADPITED